ncbi:MAG: ATP-binding protein [Actinomycetota bacterium]
MTAETVNDILGYVTAAAFGLLGCVSLWYWLRRRDRPSLWAALCFGTLGAVALAGQVLPETADSGFEIVVQRLLVVVLVLFPYLLFKFTAAFDPSSRRLEWTAAAATAGLIAWTIALPDFPQAGEHRTLAFSIYLYMLLLQFGFLSTIAAYRLWRAGRDQPSVARNRMRMLSLAAIALTATLFFAVVAPADEQGLQIAISGLGIASALAFLLGFSPPGIVRLIWRRPEQERVRHAIIGLMAATTPEEVAADVLPPMMSLVGARAVFLLDADDKVIARHGADVAVPSEGPNVLRIDVPGGCLVIWGGLYAPFFGSEEIDLLRSLGALTGLALDRSRLFVREREQRIALERADEMKTNFIALAAHELRTPVTSVHGVVRTLDRLGDQLAPEDREELEEALRSQTERMRGLVDQLLDLSRLEADTVPIQPVRIPVRAEIEDLVMASASGREDEVEIAIPEDLEAVVDKTVFERVISNLLTNAIRHGASPIVVTAAQSDNHFRVTVEDAGAGVPPRFIHELFERFSRSDEARARGLGSGLGLAIARSYARAHGGDLVHENIAPHGARFQLIVPSDRGRATVATTSLTSCFPPPSRTSSHS